MEDGLDLLRAWLRPEPDVHGGTPGPRETPAGRTLESVFVDSLARALAFGARDVDVRVAPYAGCGRFTEVTLEDTAPGLSLTALRAWLSGGVPPNDPERDRTRPAYGPPVGPPGSALTRFRTSSAGQTVEAWVLPDGTWELHLHTAKATGNRQTWYFSRPGPEETLERLRTAVAAALVDGPLRVWLQGAPCVLAPTSDGVRFHVEREDAVVRWRLELLDRPAGALVLSHRGFVFHRGPEPAPWLRFWWDGALRPEERSTGAGVAADLRAARRELGEQLLIRLMDNPAMMDDWRRFLEGHPDPGWRARPVGRDVRGVSFSITDMKEKIVLPMPADGPAPPAGHDVLVLDGGRWTPEAVRALSNLTLGGPVSRPSTFRCLAARRLELPADHPCAAWPRLWEEEAARDPRLAFARGLRFAGLHRPVAAAWPFFPMSSDAGLARLRSLPTPPWELRGALWVAVDHPLIVHLSARLAPRDAVRLLADLVLLAQDQEPGD